MVNKQNSYARPLDLLLACLQQIPKEEMERRFASTGEGYYLQEVVDATRLHSTTELLDQFSFSDDSKPLPRPETEDWWVIFQWHPVNKQLIRGDELRRALASKDHTAKSEKSA